MAFNQNLKIINTEVDEINFDNIGAVENILWDKLAHIEHDYDIKSVSVSINKNHKYAIVAIIEVFPEDENDSKYNDSNEGVFV